MFIVEAAFWRPARQALAARLLTITAAMGVRRQKRSCCTTESTTYILRLLHSAHAWGVVILLAALDALDLVLS